MYISINFINKFINLFELDLKIRDMPASEVKVWAAVCFTEKKKVTVVRVHLDTISYFDRGKV